MTAEIAILNRSAVALAADSAVTVQHGKGFKIFQTNKLFHLCHTNPVGIMVYQNADLMSVPWETIIKNYRNQLADTTFNTLEEYATNFIAHLSSNLLLFPEDVQDDFANRTITYNLRGLGEMIDESVKEAATKKPVSERQIQNIARKTINRIHGILKDQPTPPDLPASIEKDILQRYEPVINQEIAEFNSLRLSTQFKNRLRDIAIWAVSKDLSEVGWDNYSGLVFAGFGASDLYPALMTFRVDSVVLNHLKYTHITKKSERISATRLARVIPFAQDEMVSGFMEGIDPNFLRRIGEEMGKILLDVYPEEIVKRLPRLTKKQQADLLTQLKKVGQDSIGVFANAIQEHRQKKHIDPVVKAVSVLPKEDLAQMAEALVSLTSTKRRVTLDAETVGGPVDVAIISKGDGFIWIRRKHYFDADKNPQFFSKYNH